MQYLETNVPTHGNFKYNNDVCLKELIELDQKLDWDDLTEAIFPLYVKSKIKPTLLTVESMFRIYILGHYFDESPSGVKKALLQTNALREFALIDLDHDDIPNESSIADFNSVLIEKNLAAKIEQALSMQASNASYSAAF